MTPALKRRLFFAAVALGLVALWRGGLGVFPSERTVTWQLPVEYFEVRAVDLQLWRDDTLLVRDERAFPEGVRAELHTTVALLPGTHRAVATARLANGASATFSLEVTVGDDPAVLVAPRR